MMNDVLPTGQVLAVTAYPGDYTLLRIAAPEYTRHLQSGQYLEINSESWLVLLI